MSCFESRYFCRNFNVLPLISSVHMRVEACSSASDCGGWVNTTKTITRHRDPRAQSEEPSAERVFAGCSCFDAPGSHPRSVTADAARIRVSDRWHPDFLGS
jgi:hypothetical protein